MREDNRLVRLWNRSWPLLVLALLVVMFFWRSILFGEVFVPADLLEREFPWKPYFPPDFQRHNHLTSDIIDSQYPARAVARQIIHSGQLPLWDPYTLGGKPLGTMPIYPLSLPLNVLLWLLPLDVGFTLVTAVRLFISGVAMFAFLRELQLGKMPALVGGITFAFNGFVIVWLNATAGTTLSLAPLVFWSGERTIKKANGGNLSLLALTVGALVSAGFLAVVLYVLYALTAYLIFRAGQAAWQQRNGREALQKLLLVGLAIVLGLALMAPQLGSFWDHLRLTNYNEFRTDTQAGLVSEPLYNAVRYLIPDYYGKPATLDWFGSYPERTGYVGILPLILVSLTLLSHRQKGIVWFFAGLGLVAIGTVYGAPVNHLIARLPGLMVAPATRLKSIFALSVAVLAAFGLDALQRSPKKNGWKTLAIVIVTACGMLAVITLVERYWATVSAPVPQHFNRTLWQLWQADDLSHRQFDNLLSWSLWLLSSVVLVLARVKRFLSRRMLGISAILLICADLVGWGMAYNRPIERSLVFPQTSGITFLQNQPGLFRVTGLDATLFPNTPSVYQLQDIVGHDPLAPDRYRVYLQAIDPKAKFVPGTVLLLRSKTANLNSPLLDLLNLKYLAVSPEVTAADLELDGKGFSLAYKGPDLSVYENEDVLPRCYIVNQIEVVQDAEALLSRLTQADVAPRDTVLLEESPPESFRLARTEEQKPSFAEITTYTANRVRVRAMTATPGFLVLADMHYPGWQASVDGQRTRIYRANYLFRAIYLEPGEHVIEFTFRPQVYSLGWGVRVVALLAIGVMAAWGHIQRAFLQTA